MTKNFTLALLFGFFFTGHIWAQSSVPATSKTQEYGKVDIADLELKTCDFEKNANAMVLFDKSDVYFTDGQVNNRHVRIKIFNDKTTNVASIRLPYVNYHNFETIRNLQAETINLVDGKIEITKVEPKQIYLENTIKLGSTIVFTFPNVKAGSIIEYKYHKESASYFIPVWYFQSTIPVKYSEVNVETPSFIGVKLVPHTRQPFLKNTETTTRVGTAYAIAMANVPSLNKEPYMTSMLDNLQCMFFQPMFMNFSDMRYTSYDGNWKRISESLTADDDFGGQLNRHLTGEDAILKKAKTYENDDDKIAYVFNEVKNRLKWDNNYGLYTGDGTVKAWSTQTGSSTEINLILYHLLKQAGLNAYPMIVSTHNNGKVNIALPYLRQFNNTVVCIPVDSATNYVLDASNKYNSYKTPPYNLLNTFGIIIKPDGKKYDFIFIKSDMPTRQAVMVNAEVLPTGKMTGSAQISSFSYNKHNIIERYKKDGEDQYKTDLKDKDNNIEISSLKIENMEVDSLPLMQTIDFKLALTGSEGDYIYFSPNLFSSLRANPFLSENRVSDIDFNYLNNYLVNGTYKIPIGYKTDVLPKNTTLVMPDQSISFRRLVVENEGTIQVYYTIGYKKTIFFQEDYPELREFYKKMYDMLNEQIVLKKG